MPHFCGSDGQRVFATALGFATWLRTRGMTAWFRYAVGGHIDMIKAFAGIALFAATATAGLGLAAYNSATLAPRSRVLFRAWESYAPALIGVTAVALACLVVCAVAALGAKAAGRFY